MYLWIALIAGLAGMVVWLYFDQCGRLKRQVEDGLRRTQSLAPDGSILFNGAQAEILLRDFMYAGTEESGPFLSASYLCQMPDGGVFRILVESPRGGEAAVAEVIQLDQAEIDGIRAMYPYLGSLQARLHRKD